MLFVQYIEICLVIYGYTNGEIRHPFPLLIYGQASVPHLYSSSYNDSSIQYLKISTTLQREGERERGREVTKTFVTLSNNFLLHSNISIFR